MVKNDGVLPQYLVENGHPAIISKELFDEVQAKMSLTTRSVTKRTPFNGKIICDSCGTFYGRRKWLRIDGIYSWVWECPQKYKQPKCENPHLYEDFIYDAYYRAIVYLFNFYAADIIGYLRVLKNIVDTDMLLDEFEIFMHTAPKQALFDINTWLVMTKKVIVTIERKLLFELISGRAFVYTIPERVEGKSHKTQKLKSPKKTTKIRMKCVQCGKIFESYICTHRIYCSRDCYAKSKKQEMKR